MKYLMILTIMLVSCSTSPMAKKQGAIIDCVKDLKETDTETLDAFEVCRQVYRLKKVKE